MSYARFRAALQNCVRHNYLSERLPDANGKVLVAMQCTINLKETERIDRVSANVILVDLRWSHLACKPPYGSA